MENVPELAFDSNTPQYHRDPAPFLASLRAHHPLQWSPLGGVVVTRWEDVVDLLSSDRVVSPDRRVRRGKLAPSRAIHPVGVDGPLPPTLLGLDGPLHSDLRSRCMRHLRPGALTRLAERFADDARRTVAALSGRRMELLSEVLRPYSARSVASALGMSPTVAMDLVEDVARLAQALDPELMGSEERRIDRSSRQVAETIRGVLLGGAQTSGESLVADLVEACASGEVSVDQATSLLLLIYAAGVETTAQFVAAVLVDDLLTATPSVEDLFPAVSPVQFVERAVQDDIEMHGQCLKKGTRLFLSLAAANWDPARPSASHVAFGRGSHYCLGAALARQSAPVVLQELSRSGVTVLSCRRSRQFVIRGFKTVHAELGEG